MAIDLELSRLIKEQYCQVSQDHDGTVKMIREGQIPKERVYKLPGTHRDIVIETENLIGTPEMLFHPQKQEEREVFGLHKALYESALKCDPEIRTQLLRNIVLAGGTTTMEGFKDRITKEINALCSSMLQPQVIAPADRKFSAWLGGSLISNLSSFESLWITKE